MPRVAALAAQMAAGSGDSRIEFDGDAGELRSIDLSACLPKDADYSNLNNTSNLNSTSSKGPSKLRTAVSAVALKEQMVQRKADVLDVLSLLESMNEDGENRMRALHRRINESNEEAVKQLRAFDAGFEWLDTVGFDIPRLMREGKLTLDTTFYQEFGNPVRTPDPLYIKNTFDSLESKLYLGVDAEAMKANIRREVTKVLFPFGDREIPETMLSLNAFTMTDIVGQTTASLNESQAALTSVQEQLEAAERRLTDALGEEQMSVAEAAEADIVKLSEQWVELCIQRIQLMNNTDKGQGEGLIAQLERIIRNPAVVALHDEKSKLKDTAEDDIRKLEADRVVKLRENDVAISKYNYAVEQSVRTIQANHKLQDDKWKAVEEMLMDLVRTNKEGERLVRAHVLLTEVEQMRRQEHREFRDCYAKHRQTLDDLVTNTDSALGFVASVKASMENGRNKMIEKRVEATLKELLARERRQYLTAFEKFGTVALTDCTRAERKLEGFDRMTQSVAFMRNCSVDHGDEEGTQYAKRLHDMEKAAKKTKKSLEKLQSSFEKHEGLYVKLESSMVQSLRAGDEGGGGFIPADVPDTPQLHFQLQEKRAEQYRLYIEKVHGMLKKNSHSVGEAKTRQEQLSVEVSTFKEKADQKKQEHRSFQQSRAQLTTPSSKLRDSSGKGNNTTMDTTNQSIDAMSPVRGVATADVTIGLQDVSQIRADAEEL